MSKDDWWLGGCLMTCSALGVIVGVAAGYWGTVFMMWWLLSLALGAIGMVSWVIAKRLIRWAGIDPESSAVEGAVDMVVLLLENGFRTLPFVAWMVSFWIGTGIGTWCSGDWLAALGVLALWPVVTICLLCAKGRIDDWREERREMKQKKLG